HVSSRKDAYMYIPSFSDISVDYILVDVGSLWYTWQQPEIFGERIPPNVYTKKVLDEGTYGILVWQKNILLLKKGYTDKPIMYDPHPGFNYETLTLDSGSIIEDPSSASGFVLNNAEGDSKDLFWYGPYVDLLPGLYKATFVIKVNDILSVESKDHILTVDVTESLGKVLLGRKHIYGLDVSPDGQWFNISISFGLMEPTVGLEFRGLSVGDHNISLDYLTLEEISSQPSSLIELAFDFGSLVVDNGVVSDGVLVHSKGSGTFWYGPYVSLPAGDYVAKFWLKLDEPYNGPLLDIGVTTNLDQNFIANSTIHSSDFEEIDIWQSFEIVFTLTEDSNTTEFFGLNVKESAPISFLVVEVKTNTEELP
ncbi:MAG TPA: hypothetical protein VMX17_03115, partial [Candidatus Glassbacteria bacterium]|nr:hypothetical protein [Candidatus Glassbacteria bacterium]